VLTGADFRGADLTHAVLRAADLSSARGLRQDQLDEACGDGTTKLPRGLTVGTCGGRTIVVVDGKRIVVRKGEDVRVIVPKPPKPPKPPRPPQPDRD
jgi:hypothetical protein